MNHTRGFGIDSNGPDQVRLTYSAVNLQGTGLSTYHVTVPYERDSITLHVDAEFAPIDDGKQWTALEYCDLYPFENVNRRDFHYDDVTFLNRLGEFDRVGTGAWAGGFETVFEKSNRQTNHGAYSIHVTTKSKNATPLYGVPRTGVSGKWYDSQNLR